MFDVCNAASMFRRVLVSGSSLGVTNATGVHPWSLGT